MKNCRLVVYYIIYLFKLPCAIERLLLNLYSTWKSVNVKIRPFHHHTNSHRFSLDMQLGSPQNCYRFGREENFIFSMTLTRYLV